MDAQFVETTISEACRVGQGANLDQMGLCHAQAQYDDWRRRGSDEKRIQCQRVTCMSGVQSKRPAFDQRPRQVLLCARHLNTHINRFETDPIVGQGIML